MADVNYFISIHCTCPEQFVSHSNLTNDNMNILNNEVKRYDEDLLLHAGRVLTGIYVGYYNLNDILAALDKRVVIY